MKKQEMEAAYQEYEAWMRRARESARGGLFRDAVQEALEAWPFIDGMMLFARKYLDREFNTIPAIDLVLEYVPLLLDYRQLDRLEALLKERRRIERDTSADVGAQVREARTRMWAAYRLWGHIEGHHGVRQSELRTVLGGEQGQWVRIVETWERMGLLRRTPLGATYQLSLCTRMGEITPAKCPACGASTEAPKAMLLDELSCPQCGKRVAFVLVPSDAGET